MTKCLICDLEFDIPTELDIYTGQYLPTYESKSCIGNNFCGKCFPMENESLKKYIKILKKKYGKSWSCKEVFVTYKPPECDGTVDKVKKVIDKLLQCKNIETAYGQYEWRNHDKETGLHAHIMCRITELKLFNDSMKNRKKDKIKWDFVYNNTRKSWFNDKVKYMEGDTESPEKNEKKLLDKKLREKFGVEAIKKNYSEFVLFD